MTKLTATRSEQAQERYISQADSFWEQTVAENNLRLDGVTTPAALRSELKLIEAVLLTRFNPRDV